jgi:hypothetical protein
MGVQLPKQYKLQYACLYPSTQDANPSIKCLCCLPFAGCPSALLLLLLLLLQHIVSSRSCAADAQLPCAAAVAINYCFGQLIHGPRPHCFCPPPVPQDVIDYAVDYAQHCFIKSWPKATERCRATPLNPNFSVRVCMPSAASDEMVGEWLPLWVFFLAGQLWHGSALPIAVLIRLMPSCVNFTLTPDQM